MKARVRAMEKRRRQRMLGVSGQALAKVAWGKRPPTKVMDYDSG
jgi:hypothetical protein